MVVLLLVLRLPGGDGGQSLIGTAFITDDGMGREACGQRFSIAGIFQLKMLEGNGSS